MGGDPSLSYIVLVSIVHYVSARVVFIDITRIWYLSIVRWVRAVLIVVLCDYVHLWCILLVLMVSLGIGSMSVLCQGYMNRCDVAMLCWMGG